MCEGRGGEEKGTVCVLCAKNASGVFWSIPNVLIFRADLLKVVYADDYY